MSLVFQFLARVLGGGVWREFGAVLSLRPAADEIAALEKRRLALGLGRAELALKMGTTEKTLQRAVASGRIKTRTLKAWRMALRASGIANKQEEDAF